MRYIVVTAYSCIIIVWQLHIWCQLSIAINFRKISLLAGTLWLCFARGPWFCSYETVNMPICNTHIQPFYGQVRLCPRLTGWASTRKVKPIWMCWSKGISIGSQLTFGGATHYCSKNVWKFIKCAAKMRFKNQNSKLCSTYTWNEKQNTIKKIKGACPSFFQKYINCPNITWCLSEKYFFCGI